jgi:hypothetical protein
MNTDHELEAALGRVLARADEADDAGTSRVLARLESGSLPAQKRRLYAWPPALTNWEFAPAWPRLAALACAAVFGIGIGFSNLGQRIASNLDLVQVASADDAGGNVFDVDSVTGLRP